MPQVNKKLKEVQKNEELALRYRVEDNNLVYDFLYDKRNKEGPKKDKDKNEIEYEKSKD